MPVPVRPSLGIHLCQDCGSEQAAETRAETLHGHFSSITEGLVPGLLHLWAFREWLQAAPWFITSWSCPASAPVREGPGGQGEQQLPLDEARHNSASTCVSQSLTIDTFAL